MLAYSGSALLFSMHSRGKFQCFLIQVNFKEHLSVTTSGKMFMETMETINCFYYISYILKATNWNNNRFYYNVSHGSRIIAPEETQTLTLTGKQFSSGAFVRIPFYINKNHWVDGLFQQIILIQNTFYIMKSTDNTFVKQFHFFQ